MRRSSVRMRDKVANWNDQGRPKHDVEACNRGCGFGRSTDANHVRGSGSPGTKADPGGYEPKCSYKRQSGARSRASGASTRKGGRHGKPTARMGTPSALPFVKKRCCRPEFYIYARV